MQVSVIIPVYNAAPFIDKSIQSALDQPQTAEVLVINDRSSDDSWAKCIVWAQKDTRVRLFQNEGPKGSGAARNIGLKNASCEYIAFLDADDYYLEGRFEGDDKLFISNTDIDGIINHLKFSTPSDMYIHHNAYINENTMGPETNKSLITPLSFVRYDSGSIITLTIKNNTLKKQNILTKS
jgi:glycosyltransferase involved in cell wall biosynthesis